jgi:hypothetical protein
MPRIVQSDHEDEDFQPVRWCDASSRPVIDDLDALGNRPVVALCVLACWEFYVIRCISIIIITIIIIIITIIIIIIIIITTIIIIGIIISSSS